MASKTKARPAAGRAQRALQAVPAGRNPDLDVEATIHDMPDRYLQCRDFNHSWRAHDARFDRKSRSYEVLLKCTRCKAVRRRLLDSEGSVVTSGYDYPDGYLIKGMGRITGAERNALRLESVLRLIPDSAKTRAG